MKIDMSEPFVVVLGSRSVSFLDGFFLMNCRSSS
jgi:hypothetical protein